MTPEHFIAKWRGSALTERSASHQHFLDLCELLDVPRPADVDQRGTEYTFDKRTRKLHGETGYADVWKRHCFAWEYKGPRKNLVAAYAQLKQYADALENPPLLIVSDIQEIRAHTNFTNRITQQHVVQLPDLISVEKRQLLRWCFTAPERLEPSATRESVTAEAAARFGKIGALLRQQFPGQDRKVAHFLTKLVFCLFVEDIDLLPDRIFADIVDEAVKRPEHLTGMLADLFRAMASPNSRFGKSAIRWFNGGLFDDDEVLAFGNPALRELQLASRLDWSAIDPSIFGNLFESGLDDQQRAKMARLFDEPPLLYLATAPANSASSITRLPDKGVGIHYTDEQTIMKLVEPVVLRPLRAEWHGIKTKIKSLLARKETAKLAPDLYADFRNRLGKFRVLDPACGSGNFLALSLSYLKDFDLAVIREAEELGLPVDKERVGPEAVLGLEINPYAAELAKLTVWIAELQWQLRNGFGIKRVPILGKLDGIVCRDALINSEGSEAEWPKADVIIGNPPFLGTKLMYRSLGKEYTDRIRHAYAGRVSPFADLVCFWFEKARSYIVEGKLQRAGLVATNSIRGGKNRLVLDAITKQTALYEAWSDEPWVIKGAAVRVSLICFASLTANDKGRRLDGHAVENIFPDLTAEAKSRASANLTAAKRLSENAKVAFIGTVKAGAFDIAGDVARQWLLLPRNPNGRPNSDVLVPWMNGLDITRRPSGRWIIDFGLTMNETDAAFYEAPFDHVLRNVRPARRRVRRPRYRDYWWLEAEPCSGMRSALSAMGRFCATPVNGKHRLFVWLQKTIQPDHQLVAVARDDDTSFGILHSRFHEIWALGLGTWLGVGNDPRYTPTTTFETFPFPEGLTPNIPAVQYANDQRAKAIAKAARELDRLRNAWLNPTDLIQIVPEVVPGFPDRIMPANPAAESELKKRTLTNLYNQRPTWLANAHRDLDAAVAKAYGWQADISDDEALARLLELNHERAARQARAPKPLPREKLRREPEFPLAGLPGGKATERGIPALPAEPAKKGARRA